MFGDRSVGLYDPGMVVVKRMLESLEDEAVLLPPKPGKLHPQRGTLQ